jgi:hypothetical protein
MSVLLPRFLVSNIRFRTPTPALSYAAEIRTQDGDQLCVHAQVIPSLCLRDVSAGRKLYHIRARMRYLNVQKIKV